MNFYHTHFLGHYPPLRRSVIFVSRPKIDLQKEDFSYNLSSINIFQFWKEKKIYNNISMAIQSQKKGKKRNNKCTKITPTDCYFLHQNG